MSLASVDFIATADMHADLRCAVALQHLEQDRGAQPKREAHHQAGAENIQEPGKDREDRRALQLNIIAQSLITDTTHTSAGQKQRLSKLVETLLLRMYS